MKMTKKQRAEVVELLRCVWDRRNSDDVVSCRSTGIRIGAEAMTIHLAIKARNRTAMERFDEGLPALDSYHDECLEAAARIEEGWTP